MKHTQPLEKRLKILLNRYELKKKGINYTALNSKKRSLNNIKIT